MKGRPALAGLGLLAALATTAAAAPTQSVTLHVERFYSHECNCFKLHFSGRVSSGADEYVVIMQQKCGNKFSTAAGGTTTAEGGSWLAEIGLPFSHDSATYRARWRGQLSQPWTFRPQITVWPPARLGGGRFRVAVYADPAAQTLRRRFVVLQRLEAGRWTRLRRARLVPSTAFAGQYSATFTVRARGLTLRALVPAKTAAPCYTANVTETFRT